MLHWVVFINEMKRFIIVLKRYFFNSISSFAAVYLIFLALFFGIEFVGGPDLDASKLDNIMLGYIMWMFAVSAYSEISRIVAEESLIGTLEQLYMSPMGFHSILIFRIISGFIFSLVINFSLLFLTMATTGRWLEIPFLKFILLIAMSVPSMYGIGYVVGGLSLLFKQVQSFANIMQFGLIFLVALPAYPLNIFSFFPFSAGAYTINQIVLSEVHFDISWYLFILGNSLVYFILGMFFYRVMEKKAMKLNLLGQY